MSLQDTANKITANIAAKITANPDPTKVKAEDLAEILNDHNRALVQVATPTPPSGVSWQTSPVVEITGNSLDVSEGVALNAGVPVTVAPDSMTLATVAAGYQQPYVLVADYLADPAEYEAVAGAVTAIGDSFTFPPVPANRLWVASFMVTEEGVTQVPIGAIKQIEDPYGNLVNPDANGKALLPAYAIGLVMDGEPYDLDSNGYIPFPNVEFGTRSQTFEIKTNSQDTDTDGVTDLLLNGPTNDPVDSDYHGSIRYRWDTVANTSIMEVCHKYIGPTSTWERLGSGATPATGTVLTFMYDKVYGTEATPMTGNITADFTSLVVGAPGAILGVTNLVIHNSGTEPTFSSEFYKLSGSGDYVLGVNNYIYCQYLNATKILYTISQ